MNLTEFNTFYKNRELIWSFVKRDLIGKYKGSFFGILWSFINPLFMLLIYTIVFSVFFKMRARPGTGTSYYSLFLFCGMVPWIAFSQALNRSSGIILSNVNFVKKTVFPLEILPLVSTLSGFAHSLFGLFILFAGLMIMPNQQIYITYPLLVIVMIPQLLLTAGISWFLASIGVFIRDVREIVNMVLIAWMYMTPVFYPANIIPDSFKPFMKLNPMYTIVENYRNVLIYGKLPDWESLFILTIFALGVAVLGHKWFIKSKTAFADVI